MGYRTPDIGIHTYGKPTDLIKAPINDPFEPDRADNNELIPDNGNRRNMGLKPFPAVAEGFGVSYNTPGTGEQNAKPVKDMVRTPGKEDSEPLDLPNSIVFKRRRIEGAMEGQPYPDAASHQHKQTGKAKSYYKRYYGKNKSKIKELAKRWYKKHKNRGDFKRNVKREEATPARFDRKPGGGYSDPADRSRDEREEVKKEAGTIFYMEKVVSPGTEDRASDRVPDEGKPALDIYVKDNPHSPASGKVIPEGKGFVNKLAGFFEALPHPKKKLLLQLIQLPIWVHYQQGKVNERPILDWFSQHDWNLSPKEFHALLKGVSQIPIKTKLSSLLVRSIHAASLASLLDNTIGAVHSRADDVKVKVFRVNRKRGVWLFNAKGRDQNYRVRLKMADTTGPIENQEVEVSCSCPFFRWQGPEHWGSQEGYLYGNPVGTASEPVIRDPFHAHGACKHVCAAAKMIIDRYSKIRGE